jgi:hypothetical protein
MTKREIKTVTQCGMVSSQPGTSVGSSHFHGSGVYVLNASRYYPDMPNAFGGKGVFKKLDCDGMEFSTREAAHQFALANTSRNPVCARATSKTAQPSKRAR